MRIIARITEATVLREILRALGAPIAPPTSAPARGPPLWAAMGDAASDAAASDALPADTRAAPAPDFVIDQRIAGSSGLRARRHGAAGAACASHGQRPEVGPPALRCRRAQPGNLAHHRVGGGSFALARRLTGITKPGVLGLVG